MLKYWDLDMWLFHFLDNWEPLHGTNQVVLPVLSSLRRARVKKTLNDFSVPEANDVSIVRKTLNPIPGYANKGFLHFA